MAAGEAYNRLTSLEDAAGSHGMILWRCECGGEKRIRATYVRCGMIRSCGCLQREAGAANLNRLRADLSNFSKHELYGTWRGILYRTMNPAHRDYANYGGRGIAVCERWLDAETFYADIERLIGPRPSRRFSLDRIDNDGNYEPGNVRWATRSEQASNQRRQASARARTRALEAEVIQLREQVRTLDAQLGLRDQEGLRDGT